MSYKALSSIQRTLLILPLYGNITTLKSSRYICVCSWIPLESNYWLHEIGSRWTDSIKSTWVAMIPHLHVCLILPLPSSLSSMALLLSTFRLRFEFLVFHQQTERETILPEVSIQCSYAELRKGDGPNYWPNSPRELIEAMIGLIFHKHSSNFLGTLPRCW